MKAITWSAALLTAAVLALPGPAAAAPPDPSPAATPAASSPTERATGAKHTHLVVARSTVYPRATVVHDRTLLLLVVRGWNPYDAEYGGWQQRRAILRIVNAHGRVVWRDSVHDTYTPTFRWDGRRPDGRPLPAGTYTARMRSVATNGHRMTRSASLEVSDERLVEELWTTTLTASSAASYEPYFGACNGCGEYCAPVPSTRFAGGLSFRPCDDGFSWGTSGRYGLDVPFEESGVDRYRVAATGGATSDQPAEASLSAGERVGVDVGPADATTWTPWVRVDLRWHPFLPGQRLPVVWGFTTTGANSSDVATFSVEYRHYVPAP